jgi:hypothetical protein
LHAYVTQSFTLKEEHKLQGYENKILRKVFGLPTQSTEANCKNKTDYKFRTEAKTNTKLVSVSDSNANAHLT